MKLIDLPELQNLPVREKLRLVDELWLSMTAELESLEVSREERETLDERWATFLLNPRSALTLEEFQERMKALGR
jgi:putative addiction module component (TIGR02574 family)